MDNPNVKEEYDINIKFNSSREAIEIQTTSKDKKLSFYNDQDINNLLLDIDDDEVT